MIVLDFMTALSLALSVALFSCVLAWLFTRKTRRGGAPSGLEPRFVWVCAVCTYNYVNTREESISVCPRCGSYNKR